jgi:rod shape-determining protein MreC
VAGPTSSRRRTRLTLLLLILVSITLLTLDGRSFGPLGAIRSAVGTVLSPVADLSDRVFRPVGDAWSALASGGDLREENDRLAARVEELEREQAEAEVARRELAQLSADLDIEALADQESVVARVVRGAVGNYDAGVQINRGSDAGVAVGMPVVGGTGLVGRVAAVTPTRSTLELVTDPAFRVGVRVAGGTGLGVVSGTGSPTEAKAASFDADVPLAEGDLLVTSGAPRSVFPPDLPVGRVEGVRVDTLGLEKQADVELAARFADLSFVTVLLWEPPE